MVADHPAYGRVRRVSDYAEVLTEHNPGPMTLDGTNTYLLSAPGAEGMIVVDPGEDDEDHLRAVAAHRTVLLTLITHGHPDHTTGAARFAELTGAPVRAADGQHCHGGGAVLTDGEVIEAAGLQVRVIAAPGHSSDSLAFRIEQDGSVLTGDTVLGRGTTVIAHPDGALGPYLDTLDRLEALGPGLVMPAHGAELPDLPTIVRAYRAHRQQRLDQVRAVLAELGLDADTTAVTDAVYADVDPSVRFAAEKSVRAQLGYLREHG